MNADTATPMLTCSGSLTGCLLVMGESWCYVVARPSPELEMILREIEGALDAELYYLALMLGLAIPDICGALENESGWSTRDRYKAWYDAHLASLFPFMTADDCYSLRCGVVHQGRMGLKNKQTYSRVIFTLPVPGGNVVHGGSINDVLQFDAVWFCRDIIKAARQWFWNAQTRPVVRRNLPNMVRLRPRGFSPYVVGPPVIA